MNGTHYAIAAYAIGADEGFIYVRREYPIAVRHVRAAIRKAEARGMLGTGIFGSPFTFRLHVRERRFGAFQRILTLCTPVNSDKADAQFEHGVLTLTLPKSEAAKPRQIKIGASSTKTDSGK